MNTPDDITMIGSQFVTQFMAGSVRFELWEPDDLRSDPALFAFDSDLRRHACPTGQAIAMKARIDAFFNVPTNPPENPQVACSLSSPAIPFAS